MAANYKSAPSPTELLLIVLISHKVATSLYELQKETLLSPGALVPALRKLKARRCVRVHKAGPRGRKQFYVPEEVLAELESEWTKAALSHIDDFDAVLKLCKAAENANLPKAVAYAHAAAKRRASELDIYADDTGRRTAPKLEFDSYPSYKELARFYQLQAEESTLKALEAALRTDL